MSSPDRSYTLIDQMIDISGNRIDMTISGVLEDDILRQNKIKNEEAIEEEYEGFMGNYGNTLERWYRHAAVILWPQEYQLEILAGSSIEAAITYLGRLYTNKDADFSKDLQVLFSLVENDECSPRDQRFSLLTLVLSQKDELLATLYCRHFLFAQDKEWARNNFPI